MAESSALPLVILSEQFAKLPGIGMKSAQRLAYHVMEMDEADAKAFISAFEGARKKIKSCRVCLNFTDREVCPICSSPKRDQKTICVVESPKDVTAFERTKEYNGVYHVLHGLISPVEGVMPDMIHIKELLKRVSDNDVDEVIMATNPTVEGEATAMYIAKLLKPFEVRVTRLAFGLPVGGMLEYADEVTLYRALENRNEI